MQKADSNGHIIIGMGEFGVATNGDVLVTISLGSCVAVILCDPSGGKGGLAHAMLPSSADFRPPHTAKFVDVAVELMLKEMSSRAGSLYAYIVGGANMFPSLTNADDLFGIGERNAAAARLILKAKGIPVRAEDTGKNHGRTVEFRPANCEVLVKSVKHGIKKL